MKPIEETGVLPSIYGGTITVIRLARQLPSWRQIGKTGIIGNSRGPSRLYFDIMRPDFGGVVIAVPAVPAGNWLIVG